MKPKYKPIVIKHSESVAEFLQRGKTIKKIKSPVERCIPLSVAGFSTKWGSPNDYNDLKDGLSPNLKWVKF